MAEARRGWWMELGSQGSQRETVVGRAGLGVVVVWRAVIVRAGRRKRDSWHRMRVRRDMVSVSSF